MEERALTVTQISMYFKQIFDAEEMLFNVKVMGEISGLSIVRGVAYFTLKDENATMSCVCFDSQSFSFKNGDKVIVTGTPKYYVKGGKLNFNVIKISNYGLGELYQKFLELKERLEKKGYFDDSHKIEMPTTIKRIGVVTSKEGAVIQDIINVRTRRNPYIDIVLYPVKVQGINAEYEIANGIKFLDSYNVDLIIVARGGGSLEDLQPFNTEVVADAVYNAQKFIVSAVGHETDFTICDFCSDLRAPTPSAAAELVCFNINEKVQEFLTLNQRLKLAVKNNYVNKNYEFNSTMNNLIKLFKFLNSDRTEKLKGKIVKLKFVAKKYFDEINHNYTVINSKLQKLNPEEILKLGYATIKLNGNNITTVKDVCVDDLITIKMKDGCVEGKVISINGEKNGIWKYVKQIRWNC